MASNSKGPNKLSSLVLGVSLFGVVQNRSHSHFPSNVAASYPKLEGLDLICEWWRRDQQFLSQSEEVISVGGEVQSFDIPISRAAI